MAFEDDLGYDPSQQIDQDYDLSATQLISKTISLWAGRIAQYILIVGVISAASVAVSVLILSVMFGLIGAISADPFGYLISFFMDPMSDLPLLAVSVGFAFMAFILNAIVNGAAIKFTLDEYGGTGGDVGVSFSHSISRLVNIIFIQIVKMFLNPSFIHRFCRADGNFFTINYDNLFKLKRINTMFNRFL